MDVKEIRLSTILIVEDDQAMKTRLRGLVREVAPPEAFVLAAGSVAEARAFFASRDIDLALVDVRLPDGNGITLIEWMTAHLPQAQAVVVSAYAEEELILSALRAGAIGYLLKERDDVELLLSLRSLQRGGAPIDPMIARRILSLLPVSSRSSAADMTPGLLSEREAEILKLVARGHSNREIAEVLGLSRLTIEGHAKRIYRKLAVRSRTAAVHEARTRGLL